MKPDYKRFGQRVAEILRRISTDDDIGTATISAIYRAAEDCHVPLNEVTDEY